MNAKLKSYWETADPEKLRQHRENIRNGTRKKWLEKDWAKCRRKQVGELHGSPEMASRKRTYLAEQRLSAEFQEKRLAAMRKMWADPEYRKQLVEVRRRVNTAHLKCLTEAEKKEYRLLYNKTRVPSAELIAMIISSRRLNYGDEMYAMGR